MAITKILAVRSDLGRAVAYVSNPAKTALGRAVAYAANGDKTQGMLYCSTLNCRSLETAVEEMNQIKRRFGKTGGVLAYHIIQSFAPDEAGLTPELVHEIGLEFARRCFGEHYQVVAATHLDQAHLHNHILVNSVGCFDGRKYHSNSRSYFSQLRKVSDELCKEYELSVIQPAGRGSSYAEKLAERRGLPTVRGQIRRDVDLAIGRAVSWQTFVLNLQRMGYAVRCGPNVTYATVRRQDGKRAIRLKSLGEGYTEGAIRQRIAKSELRLAAQPERPLLVRRYSARFRGAFPLLPRQKVTGFMALYYRYLYLFRRAGAKGHAAWRTRALLRDDLAQFDHFVAQAQFIWSHHIESTEQLEEVKAGAGQRIQALNRQRGQLYKKRRHQAGCANAEPLSEEIRALTEELRIQRKVVKVCTEIEEQAAHLRQQLTRAQQQELQVQAQHKRKEQMNHEHRR